MVCLVSHEKAFRLRSLPQYGRGFVVWREDVAVILGLSGPALVDNSHLQCQCHLVIDTYIIWSSPWSLCNSTFPYISGNYTPGCGTINTDCIGHHEIIFICVFKSLNTILSRCSRMMRFLRGILAVSGATEKLN